MDGILPKELALIINSSTIEKTFLSEKAERGFRLARRPLAFTRWLLRTPDGGKILLDAHIRTKTSGEVILRGIDAIKIKEDGSHKTLLDRRLENHTLELETKSQPDKTFQMIQSKL